MVISTDAILRGPVWDNILERLKGTIFENQWDVYALCISIGMMSDQQIDSDKLVPPGYTNEPHYIPRTVLGNSKNKPLLEFMLQTALVTTKHLDLNEEKRLELAFSEESKLEFNPITFLTRFANFGVTKLSEAIGDSQDVELLEALMIFLSSTYEYGVGNVINDSDDFEIIEE